jgi:WD40 repeat protein/DNA-binding CsgD family transcriptional regulator
MVESYDALVNDDRFLQSVAAHHQVSEAELATLKLALQRQTAEEIARQLEISAAAVRKRLGAIYQKFHIAGTTPGKLESLRGILADHYGTHQEGDPALSPSDQTQEDWGEAISAKVFYDRVEELKQLRRAIISDRCRIVAILGIGGIGKTTLSVKAAQTVKQDFDSVIWRSLREAPTLSHLLDDWFQHLPGPPETSLTKTEQKITHLIERLKTARCLLVLDNFESILNHDTRAGEYQPNYKEYGELLWRLGESDHRSCLMLTSREKPLDITALESKVQRTRTLNLEGSELAALAIMDDKGLKGSQAQRKALAQCYDSNPLAIKIVATAIQDLFKGDIAEFLNREGGNVDETPSTVVVSNLRKLLDEQVSRLSDLEKSILYWLAINREPMGLTDLRQDLMLSTTPSQILSALEDLRRRSLLEQADGGFKLQNVVMEYITETFVETVCHEIETNQLELFSSHALIKADAKDYIRNTQIHLILQPIATNLQLLIGTTNLKDWVESTLTHLQQEAKLAQGYAAGNLLNLLAHLKHPIVGYDFSQLSIRHADLRWTNLSQVNFTDAHLRHCNFSETFGSVLSMAFSADGKYLAAGAANSEIRIWRVSTHQPIHNLTGHNDWVWAMAYATDHDWLASGSADGEVRLWNTKTGSSLWTIPRHHSRVWHVSFHHQDRWLISGSDDGEVRLWDTTHQRPTTVIQTQGTKVRSLGLSPNSRIIAMGKYDGTIDLWTIAMDHRGAKTDRLRELTGHQGRVLALAFSQSGRLMASTDEQGHIYIWRTDTWTRINRLSTNAHRVRTVAFSPDGQSLVSGSDKGHMCLWGQVHEENQSHCHRTFVGHSNWIWSVIFSPDGQTIASGSEDQSIKLWHTDTGKCLSTLKGRNNRILSLAIHPDQPIMASGSEDHAVWLWRIPADSASPGEEAQPIAQLSGHQNRVRAVAFSPKGTYLASSGDDQLVKIWSVQTGECLHTLINHQDWVRAVAFSPDRQLVASGSDDQTIGLWRLGDGQSQGQLKGHDAGVLSVAFSPDSRYLASASEDKTVKLWQLSTGHCVQTLHQHANEALCVAISWDGRYLASGGADKNIYLWDFQTFELIHTLSGHSAPVRSIAFDNIHHTLASGSDDKTLLVWDLATGQSLRTLEGHSRYVSAVAFSPRDNSLFSSGNQSICQWDSQTGQCLMSVALNKPYDGVNISRVTGLSPAQIVNLKVLGAIDQLTAAQQSPSHCFNV